MFPNATGRKRSYYSRQKAAYTKKGGRDQAIVSLRGAAFTPKTCRYISNDDMSRPDVCGEPTLKGYSYCKEHKEVCYRVFERKDLKNHTNYSR